MYTINKTVSNIKLNIIDKLNRNEIRNNNKLWSAYEEWIDKKEILALIYSLSCLPVYEKENESKRYNVERYKTEYGFEKYCEDKANEYKVL